MISKNTVVLLLRGALIVAAGLAIYWPCLHGAWLWDDSQYVTANSLLNDPHRLWKAWFAPGSYMEYYPLQETVIWLQWRAWGLDPFGYHLTNVLLHLTGALLLWRLFAVLGFRWGWLGGLIFAVHPMNVESVAWISELKNTLSLPPFLLAMIATVHYVENRLTRDYLLALVFFTVALLCKISMAPFPFVILLYIWWKHGRLTGKDFRLAAPFLAVALLLAGMTVWTYTRYGQLHPGHPFIPTVGGVGARLALTGMATSFYFLRCFWPWTPMPMVPQWVVAPPAWFDFLPWLAWLGLLAWFWKERKGWGRHALFGVGFFLLMIAPFCGLITQSYMYFTWVMDHFLYLAMIGPIGLVVATIDRTGPGWSLSRLLVGIVTVLFAVQSWSYAHVWQDETTLWEYAVQENPSAWLASYNLGNSYQAMGRFDDAITEYRNAIRLHPQFDWSHNNLGIALRQFPDRVPEAMAEFREAVRLRPHFPEAHNNLAIMLSRAGQLPAAITEYRLALADEPESVAMHYNLALALARAGRLLEAEIQLQEVLRLQPGFMPAQEMLEGLGAH